MTLDVFDLAVLMVIANHAEDGGTNSEEASREAVALVQAQGGAALVMMTPPWFGLHHSIEALVELGAIPTDFGAAQFHLASEATPEAKRVYLHTNETLLKQALSKLNVEGSIRTVGDRTTDARGVRIPWIELNADVRRGRDVVLVKGEGPNRVVALADLFTRAYEKQRT